MLRLLVWHSWSKHIPLNPNRTLLRRIRTKQPSGLAVATHNEQFRVARGATKVLARSDIHPNVGRRCDNPENGLGKASRWESVGDRSEGDLSANPAASRSPPVPHRAEEWTIVRCNLDAPETHLSRINSRSPAAAVGDRSLEVALGALAVFERDHRDSKVFTTAGSETNAPGAR